MQIKFKKIVPTATAALKLYLQLNPSDQSETSDQSNPAESKEQSK